MDERNAIAKARDEWFETNEGKSAMQKFERVFKQSPQTDMFADLGID